MPLTRFLLILGLVVVAAAASLGFAFALAGQGAPGWQVVAAPLALALVLAIRFVAARS